MKKLVRILFLAGVLTLLLCLTVMAADPTEAGIYDAASTNSDAGITVAEGKEKVDVQLNSTISGAQYLLVALKGDDKAPTEENIVYIDQTVGTGTAVNFTVYPSQLESGAVYHVYVTSDKDSKYNTDSLTEVANFKYYAANLPSIDEVALDQCSVEVDGKNDITVKATAKSKGTDITASVDWSVTPGGDGVVIAQNGSITVNSKAVAGDYTITAKPNGSSSTDEGKTAKLTVTRATPVATEVKIYKSNDTEFATPITNDTAVIPPTANSSANTYSYVGKVFDQFGAPMDTAVTWDIVETTHTGVSLSDGKLTVSYGATVGDLTIKATSGSLHAALTVKLVDVQVQDWPTAKTTAEYGTKNSELFGTLPASGSAKVGDSHTLTGKFSVKDPNECLEVGDTKNVTLNFAVDAGQGYDDTVITKDYTVKITKKPITLSIKAEEISYGETVPSSFNVIQPADGVLVGEDTVAELDLTFTTNAGTNPNAGTYTITGTSASANYDVTASGTLTVKKADITGIVTKAPDDPAILANDSANKSIEDLKTKLGLDSITEVDISYGTSGTAKLPITWSTSKTFDPKGGEYEFIGTPTVASKGNFNTTDKTLKAKITVTPVKGTPSITPTELTKASADVKKAAGLTDLGLPANVEVTYGNGVAAGSYEINEWSETIESVKAKAPAGEPDVEVTLIPTDVKYPAWATVEGSLSFKLTMTSKYPVKLGFESNVADLVYGTPLTLPALVQTEQDGKGTQADPKYDYMYSGKLHDGSTYSSDKAPTEVGTYTVTAVLVSDTYSGKATSNEFKIAAKPLTDGMVTLDIPQYYTYDKTAHEPAVTVKDGAKALIKDTDYTVKYENNVNAGSETGKVIVKGIGNYGIELTKTFTIKPASIAEMTPAVAGTAEAGKVLTASLEGVDPAELAWEWYVGTTRQSDNTAAYTVKPDDSNKEITAKAVAAEKNYTGTSQTSEAVTAAKVTVTGMLTITVTGAPGENGEIVAGSTLTADVDVEPSNAMNGAKYQWYSDGTAIEGETNATYTVKEGDRNITVTFTPDDDFAGLLNSSAVEVGKIPLKGNIAVSPVKESDNIVGTTFKATLDNELVTADDYTFVWLRDGEAIPGASGDTYTITKADRGTTIAVKAAAKGGKFTGEVISYLMNIPPAVPDAPTVTATAGDKKVTVTWNTPDANGAPITGYKVFRGIGEPAGMSPVETAELPDGTNSYTFEELENGTEYTFVVVAVNSVGESEKGSAKAAPEEPYTPPSSYPGGGITGPSTDPNTTTTTDPEGNVTTTTKDPDGTTKTTIKGVDGSSSVVTTDASGKTSAEVSLPTKTVDDANSGNKVVALPMQGVTASTDAEKAPVVVVNTANDKSVAVEIPVVNVGTGTVAVLVKSDGTETIIKTTVFTGEGIALKVNSGDKLKIVDNSKTYTDTKTHWGGDAVNFVSARELFKGTGDNAFTPDGAMTRGMLMTVLARFEDVDTGTGSTWYDKGVNWAIENGLSDGTDPDADITREQLATIMYRFAKSKGLTGSVGADLSKYGDIGQISGWASEAMSWAVQVGLIVGLDDTTLAPGGNATRAQVATIIMRYAEKFAI